MNEITRIHLGRQQFTIAIDAHKALRQYLDDNERHLGKKSKDVIKEVELRMAELLAERGVKSDKVVLLEDVIYLKEQLGSPKDFSDDDDQPEVTEGLDESPSKRLYRDTGHGMIAGVAAGMGAYLNIDPILVRILFVLGIFAGGWAILLYLLLWLIVPEARTPSERLQMHGKAVTVDNIKELVARADVPGASKRAGRTIGRVLEGLFKVLLTIAGILVVGAGLAVFSVVIVAITYVVKHRGTLFQEGFFPVGTSETMLTNIGIGMTALVGVWLVIIGVAMARRKWQLSAWIAAVLAGLFATGLAVGTALVIDAAPRIRARYQAAQHVTVRQVEPFEKVQVTGPKQGFHIRESADYKVELRYIGEADISTVSTKVTDNTLEINTEDFVKQIQCEQICLLEAAGLEITVFAPKVVKDAYLLDRPGIPFPEEAVTPAEPQATF